MIKQNLLVMCQLMDDDGGRGADMGDERTERRDMPATPEQRVHFGLLLREHRNDLGLTQRKFVAYLAERGLPGVLEQSVSNWELGKNEPESRDIVAKLDAAVGAGGVLLDALGYRGDEGEQISLSDRIRHLEDIVAWIAANPGAELPAHLAGSVPQRPLPSSEEERPPDARAR